MSDAVVVDGMPGSGGLHCESTALGALLAHAGIPLSEPMIFGLGAGLSFVYWDSKSQGMPFLGGRVKPFELTRNLVARLGLLLDEHQTSSPRAAWDRVRRSLDKGVPVGLQLDSHDLDYFGSRVHFAGHMVAMYGYDDERALLIDTAQQGGRVSTSLKSLARARAARGPMSARHRSFTVRLPDGIPAISAARAVLPAILDCADAFLSAPIANLGARGIRTAATRMRAWPSRLDDPRRNLPMIALLMERAGTGGALFRNLYRDFLTECLPIVRDASDGRACDVIAQARDGFADAALLWTEAAQFIDRAGEDDAHDLEEASRILIEIADQETRAMEALRTLA